jgi:hypothetical protein
MLHKGNVCIDKVNQITLIQRRKVASQWDQKLWILQWIAVISRMRLGAWRKSSCVMRGDGRLDWHHQRERVLLSCFKVPFQFL